MSRLARFVMGVALLAGLAIKNPAHVRAYEALTQDYRLSHVAVIGDSYTTGTDEGGLGQKSWTARAWQLLGQTGVRIAADVAAEGRAGYGVPGDHGSVFQDLTERAVEPDDVLVVYFGSLNDRDFDPRLLGERARDTFDSAHRLAPSAKFLVVGPPWPTADVPASMFQIRDAVDAAARAAGATFVDPIDERWFVDRPDLIGSDGVHPNDAGHEYLADRIAPLIRAQLSG
ncbi:GDSL-like Lipase/Acylhydrolase [Mycobacterium basiliense]|uniref:GDSL-like Lipase/Acylhydrolase n=1 Tax=Mycobacterium basiliense TaxID=2094119 RepID=A0A447G9M3_9MYCO|nr:GDSL lipase [Mycobacterium basiliense]VDM87194.1 GDSL-like Lipase/Acylhydrolase [Mycobacterium basiliense]